MSVSRKSAKRQLAPRGRRQFHDWNRGGKSAVRVFTWNHVWNEWDLKFGRCEEDQVGHEEDHFFSKATRAWRQRGGKTVWINTLPGKDEFWTEWNALTEDEQEKQWKLKPGARVYFNAFDEDYPQGVQVVNLTVPQFNGIRPAPGRRETYGVIHMWDGYDPDEIAGESLDEETEGSGEVGGLAKWPRKGDVMFGPKGQDILLFFDKSSKVGFSKTTKGGPVQMRLQKNCTHLTPEEFYLSQVQDLFMIDEFIPGYASDGHHSSEDTTEFIAWREGQPTKVQIVGAALEEEEEKPEDEQQQEETEETEEATESVEEETEEVEETEETEETETDDPDAVDGGAFDEEKEEYTEPDEPPKQKRTRRTLKQGTLVVVTDDGIKYNGTFDTAKGSDLKKGEVKVIIRVGDQEGEAKEKFIGMMSSSYQETDHPKKPDEIGDEEQSSVKVKRNQVQFAD